MLREIVEKIIHLKECRDDLYKDAEYYDPDDRTKLYLAYTDEIEELLKELDKFEAQLNENRK